jgi:hypothetical protein
MHARLLVVPSTYFATTLPGRSFTIPNVPAGKYTLTVWHERSRVLTKSITVPANGTATENIQLDNEHALSTAKDLKQ